MKIFDIANTSADTQDMPIVFSKGNATQGGDSFQRQMTAMHENTHRRYVEDLQSRINRQGDLLRQKADMNELLKYRSLISDLLNEMVSNAYVCSSQKTHDTRGQQKIFVVIRCVNEKLDALTQEVLSEQADNLKLMNMVDDIRGLLLDLLL